MIVLTLSSSQPQFTQFLLERFGIEGNMLTVDEARAAITRNGSAWNDIGFILVGGLQVLHSEKRREKHFKKRKRNNRRESEGKAFDRTCASPR